MKSHNNKIKAELVTRGFLTSDQCQKIDEETQKNRSSFKEEVVRLGLMKEGDLLTVESDILGVPFLDLDQYTVDTKVLTLIPEKIVRSHSVIPVFKLGKLTVATSDPSNILVLDEIQAAVGEEIELVLSPRESIDRAIDHYYGGVLDTTPGSSKANAAGKFTITKREGPLAVAETEKEGEEMPVINLVNSLFANAIRAQVRWLSRSHQTREVFLHRDLSLVLDGFDRALRLGTENTLTPSRSLVKVAAHASIFNLSRGGIFPDRVRCRRESAQPGVYFCLAKDRDGTA